MKVILKTVVLALLITISSCSKNEELDEMNVNPPSDPTIESEILRLINDHRASKNLTKLEISAIIKSQTDAHTNYMISKGEISHDNFSDRSDYLKQNDGVKSIAENVAIGYNSAKDVVNGWLNSDGHRRNIEGNYTHFNVTAKQNEGKTWYYTNIFSRK